MTWYERVPKVELHVHLEGAIPHEALFALIQKYGGDPSVPDVSALADRFEYKGFPQFIEAWSWKNQFLREYEDFTHIAELTARDLAEQGVRYAEAFFSPSLFVRHGLAVQDIAHAVRTGLGRVPEIEVALVADLVRDYGPESEMVTLEQLKEVKGLGIVGIGIGGSEQEYPPAPFKKLYAKARAAGFHVNAHAGEAASAQSIWDAIRELGVERVGHGTRAWEDPELVEYLVAHRIPVEMCPISNVRTGVVRCLSEHPIRRFFDAGIPVSVNTDDPKMFQTRLADEYRLLEEECGFTRSEVRRLILSAIRSAWLPKERKVTLESEFTRDPVWDRECESV
ncbi:adenosine deaminase [Candidatus Fermentibacteria bacterium]|nr:adenosine deaminase [Candidatus Fermentibacteria bacterium]